ncbi:hypothetical protein D3C87_1922450 [compost metagenome]
MLATGPGISSKWKLPSRVKTRSSMVRGTGTRESTNMASPEMATSVRLPVEEIEPCVKSVLVPVIVTPESVRWIGLTEP